MTVSLETLIKCSPAVREDIIFNDLRYVEARELCHQAGIRRIKGNCRKVLLRRLNRLTTMARNAERLAQILKGTSHGN